MGAVPVQEAKWLRSGTVGEPGDVGDFDQRPGGAGGSDAVQVEQPGAGRSHQRLELFVELFVSCLPAGVVLLEIGDQLGREPATGLADQVAWPHPRQQCLGLSRGQVVDRSFFAPPGRSSSSNACGWDTCGCVLHRALCGGRPASAAPRAGHRRPPVAARPSGSRPAPPSARRWRRSCGPDRSRTPAHLPTTADSFGGTSTTSCPVGQEPHRDVPADPVAPFDRPDTVRPPLHVLAQRPEAGDVGAEPATADDRFVGGHHLDRHRPLVRVHPDHDPLACCHLQALRSGPMCRVRGHRCYELSNPFLSHTDPAVTGTTQAMREPHPQVGSRKESDSPGHLDRDSSDPGRAVNGTSSLMSGLQHDATGLECVPEQVTKRSGIEKHGSPSRT
jgi:hypothetical protein